jgi:hypothetical protein
MMVATAMFQEIVSLGFAIQEIYVHLIVPVDHPWQILASVLLIVNVIQDTALEEILANPHALKLTAKVLMNLDAIVKAQPNAYLVLAILEHVVLTVLVQFHWQPHANATAIHNALQDTVHRKILARTHAQLHKEWAHILMAVIVPCQVTVNQVLALQMLVHLTALVESH